MSEETIIVNFDDNGDPIIEAKGIKGASCKDITKFLEKGLGVITSDNKTPEYYERLVNVAKVRI